MFTFNGRDMHRSLPGAIPALLVLFKMPSSSWDVVLANAVKWLTSPIVDNPLAKRWYPSRKYSLWKLS